jgi:hypothetical protein
MLHRLNLSARCNLSSPSPFQSIPCLRTLQKRFKHGRDFPRNIPPPPPPTGTPIFNAKDMTLYYSPPPSAPTYKSTPSSFLPPTHPFDTQSSHQRPGTQLPPPLNAKRKREKSYHLTLGDLNKMRRLRNHADPTKRKSRVELAKMFGCSQLFVGMAAPVSQERVKAVFKEREEVRAEWSPRKRFHRDERQRRREEWYKTDE